MKDESIVDAFYADSVWESVPAKRIFRHFKEINVGLVEQNRLALTMRGVINRSLDDTEGLQSADYSVYQIFEKGDLVFKLIDLENIKTSRVGIVHERGIMSPAYIRLVASSDDAYPRFYYWCFLALYLNNIFNKLGGGIRQNLTAKELLEVRIPVLRNDFQISISNFLDRETARIDKLIAEKQIFIKLLKEKRQALISHVVTKGLNPNVKMKDSGIEWIGDVPEHWELLSHRRFIRKIEQGWSPQADSNPPNDSQWGVTKLSAVKSGTFYPEECKAMLDEHNPGDGLRVSEGDFLMTRANTPDLVGDVCVVGNIHARKIILCDLIYRIVYRKSVNCRYLTYWFLGQAARVQVKIDARGSSMTMAKISQSHIKSWKIPLPPIEEQNTSVVFLDEDLEKIAVISKEVETSISLLKEHRTALISAAVTGKIDVRNH